MRKIIYNKLNGEIIDETETYQDIGIMYQNYPSEFISNLDSIEISNPPKKLQHYKVLNGELVKREVSPSEPTPNPLEKRIAELENVIDAMLGVDTDGL